MRIYCVGIGGIGLSGASQILRSQGPDVSGSDLCPSEITESLRASGIMVFDQHSAENIDEHCDLLIYSEAVPEANAERKRAKALGIRQISYAEALGMISKDKKTIAVTGTHGKTTVTGMLTSILLEAKLDPTIIIGSKIDLLGHQNFRVGRGDLFLTEACEYRGNFLHLAADVVLINNLEPDHLDYFENADNYYQAFQTLIEEIPSDGTLIICESDQDKIDLKKLKGNVKILSKELQEEFQLQVPGKHNQWNAHAAQAVAQILNVQEQLIKKGLEKFNGTWRRFEYKGSLKGAKFYDDYGHHPTEIQATIQAAREWHPDKRLILAFQPHQYSRTRHFFDQFAQAFSGSDEVWITDIYQARDSREDIEAISAEQLAKAISRHQKARSIRKEQLSTEIQNTADPNTVVLIMGAGNIHDIFHQLPFDGKGE